MESNVLVNSNRKLYTYFLQCGHVDALAFSRSSGLLNVYPVLPEQQLADGDSRYVKSQGI